MTERIDINSDNSIGNALLQAVDNLAIGSHSLERLKEATDKMVDPGPPIDYSRLALEYGCASKDAEQLYNLIVGAVADLNVPGNVSELVSRVDQG